MVPLPGSCVFKKSRDISCARALMREREAGRITASLFCSERAAFVRTEALCLLSCQHSVDHASRRIEVLTTLVRVLKNCARSNSAAAEAAHLAMHYYVGYCQGYFQEVSCLILQASPTCSSYLHLKQAMVLQ